MIILLADRVKCSYGQWSNFCNDLCVLASAHTPLQYECYSGDGTTSLDSAMHRVALFCVYYHCLCHMCCTGCRECSRFYHQCQLEALPAHCEASHWWLSEHCFHWYLQRELPELPLPRDLHTVTGWRSRSFSVWSAIYSGHSALLMTWTALANTNKHSCQYVFPSNTFQ